MRIHTPALVLSLLLCSGAFAQETDDAAEKATARREAEIAHLQRMLAKVDAALEALDPLLNPELSFAQYDVRHLFYQPTDRAAPELTIPAYSAGYRTGAGGGGFSFEDCEEGSGTLFDPDQLESLILDHVGEGQWDEPARIEVYDGYLLVTQSGVAHAKIERLLTRLKRDQTRSVQLEVGFYVLNDALQREIETEALTAQGSLRADLLSKLDRAVLSGKAKLSGSAMLVALNGQRVFLHQGGERTFVSSFERASGGTGNLVDTVADPIVDVLRTGLTLDMRASLSAQGLTTRVSMDVRFVRTKPFEISHRKTPWGPIDVPRVAVDSVRTSARVPSGGGMLVFAARASQDEAQPDVTIIVRPLVMAQGD